MSTQLSADFSEYAQWRTAVIESIANFQSWAEEQDLIDSQSNMRLQHLLSKLQEDKLNVAFVAEFSRGKSELINAIFFADYGNRILPSSAGRTTMCPTELGYDVEVENSIRLLPIETRSSHITVTELKRYPEEWVSFPINKDSADEMLSAMRRVGETKRVSKEVAARLGLYDEADPDNVLTVDSGGMVEVPCWRHALINFPHPLLQQGLVILDTPGLNAIGAEPELTLSLLPNAHAILFILAADTGVTKSDLDVWRSYLGGNAGGSAGRLVVLNKIDGLWDSLKSEAEVESEIARQVATTSDLLSVNPGQIFPVSAQKGLVAKISADNDLLARSRIGELERALSDGLIPAKLDIVRDSSKVEVDDLVASVRNILNSRAKGLQEQLDELGQLRGKNRDVVEHMMDKVKDEKAQFERGLQRFQALRSVFSQQTNSLFAYLGMEALRHEIKRVREQMDSSVFSAGLSQAMNHFFKTGSNNIAKSAEQISEIQAMMAAMYKRFSEDHGLSQVTPPPFSTLKYHKEIARLERGYRNHFNTLGTLLTTRQGALTRKFFDTVASRVVYVFDVANRDIENWLKAVMSPMETQVREHQLQLRRRLESIKRIHKATDTLEDRIAELEQAHQDLHNQIRELDSLAADIGLRLSAASPVAVAA